MRLQAAMQSSCALRAVMITRLRPCHLLCSNAGEMWHDSGPKTPPSHRRLSAPRQGIEGQHRRGMNLSCAADVPAADLASAVLLAHGTIQCAAAIRISSRQVS